LPDDLPVRGHLEDALAVRVGDQRVAVREPVGVAGPLHPVVGPLPGALPLAVDAPELLDPAVLGVRDDDRRATSRGGDVIGVVLFEHDVVVVLGAERPVVLDAGPGIDEHDLVLVAKADHHPAVLEEANVVDVRPVTGVGAAALEGELALGVPEPLDDPRLGVHDEHLVGDDVGDQEVRLVDPHVVVPLAGALAVVVALVDDLRLARREVGALDDVAGTRRVLAGRSRGVDRVRGRVLDDQRLALDRVDVEVLRPGVVVVREAPVGRVRDNGPGPPRLGDDGVAVAWLRTRYVGRCRRGDPRPGAVREDGYGQ